MLRVAGQEHSPRDSRKDDEFHAVPTQPGEATLNRSGVGATDEQNPIVQQLQMARPDQTTSQTERAELGELPTMVVGGDLLPQALSHLVVGGGATVQGTPRGALPGLPECPDQDLKPIVDA